MTLTNPAYRGHCVGELPPVTRLPNLLSADQLLPFRQLAQQVRVRGHQQRIGANSAANPSRYRILKEYAWPAEHKAALHQYLPVHAGARFG